MYTYEISFPEHAEKIVHPDHLLTTHCPVHLGELVILSDRSTLYVTDVTPGKITASR